MATTNLMANCISPQALSSKLRDYYTLTKPEVNLLILMTTSAGYYLASRGPFRIAGLVNTLIGTLLVASGTATINQWMERVWDGQMRGSGRETINQESRWVRWAMALRDLARAAIAGSARAFSKANGNRQVQLAALKVPGVLMRESQPKAS